MIKVVQNSKIKVPNMLLVSGNGQNVGKTFLACKIIKHLAKKHTVIGVKISPHLHLIDEAEEIVRTDDFVIMEETQITGKDSSLMLQAGASKVYLVMATQENLQMAFQQLVSFLDDAPIVCESGGLIEYVVPGIFLFVKHSNQQIVKKHLLQYFPRIVINDGIHFDFNISNLAFNNKGFIFN